jgi:hypothetical protein
MLRSYHDRGHRVRLEQADDGPGISTQAAKIPRRSAIVCRAVLGTRRATGLGAPADLDLFAVLDRVKQR